MTYTIALESPEPQKLTYTIAFESLHGLRAELGLWGLLCGREILCLSVQFRFRLEQRLSSAMVYVTFWGSGLPSAMVYVTF